MNVHVVIKMFQGVIDDVDVFTSKAEASAELRNWRRENNVRSLDLTDTDIDGSTVYETELIHRTAKHKKPTSN